MRLFLPDDLLDLIVEQSNSYVEQYIIFLLDDLLDLIVEQSNSYAEQYITKEKDNLSKYAGASDWKLVNREEKV